MAYKPFDRIFRLVDKGKGTVDYINGEQIARIEIFKGVPRRVTFYMSDGNTYTWSGDDALKVINAIEGESDKEV